MRLAALALLLCVGCGPSIPSSVVVISEPVSKETIGKLTPRPKIPDVLPSPQPKPSLTDWLGGILPDAKLPTAEQVAEIAEKAEPVEPEPAEPEAELVVISAAWCNVPGKPCYRLHQIADGVPGVRFIDFDQDAAEVANLWQGYSPAADDRSGRPGLFPCYVTVIDGQPVRRWVAMNGPAMTRKGLEYMRDWEPVPQAMAAAPESSYMQGQAMSPHADAPPPAPWALRIDVRPDNLSSIAKGSGVVVGKLGDEWIGATCSHVVSGAPGRLRVNSNGYWWPARIVRRDPGNDVAFVAFRCPVKQFEPAICGPAESPPVSGDTVTSHGFVGGMLYHYQEATATGSTTVDRMFLGGESGGAVTNDRGLIGLIAASDVEQNPDEGEGRMVPLSAIKAMLASVPGIETN